MSQDRSDEIRVAIHRQRKDRFMKYLERKKARAVNEADGSGSSWNHATAATLEAVYERAKRIFSGKEDKPVNLED